jgi:hypothetical protein
MPLTARRLLLAVLVVLSACATGPTIRHVRPTLGALPPTEQVPVRLGLRYEPAFALASIGHGPYGPRVPIGEDSVAMFDEVAPRLARHVGRVPPSPQPAGIPAPDFILEPTLEHFDFFNSGDSPTEHHAVVYRMSLFEPGGALVSSWTVEGRVPFAPEDDRPSKNGITHATENLAEAARRLVTGFRQDSRLEAYLARREAGLPLELPGIEVTATLEDFEVPLPGLTPSLCGLGLVPVKVKITNRGESEVRLSGLVGRLTVPDGTTLHAPDPAMIAERLEEASTTAGRPNRAPGIIGSIAWAVHNARLGSMMPAARALLTARALRAGTLPAGGSIEGHLYFIPIYGLPPPGPAFFTIWLTDTELRSARATSTLELPPRPQVLSENGVKSVPRS